MALKIRDPIILIDGWDTLLEDTQMERYPNGSSGTSFAVRFGGESGVTVWLDCWGVWTNYFTTHQSCTILDVNDLDSDIFEKK